MAVMNVNPTRMQLSKLKKQLNTALRGHKMLKDKRDELMRQFLELVREDMALRVQIEEKLKVCNAGFAAAGAVMSNEVPPLTTMSLKSPTVLMPRMFCQR